MSARYGCLAATVLLACTPSPPDKEAPRRGLGGPVDLAEVAGLAEPDGSLQRLAADGELARVRALVEAGVDVNERHPSYGRTPLQEAANYGHLETARLLLEHGADPNRGEEGDSPLRVAARLGDAEMVRLLLELGADVDWRPEYGSSALMGASSAPRSRIEYFGWSEEDFVEVVEVLLEAGADPDLTDNAGTTALIGAAKEGHAKMVATLVEAGADIDHATPYVPFTALMEAGAAGHAEVVAVLLAASADWRTEDPVGRTVVDWSWRFLVILDALEEAGADTSRARDRHREAFRPVVEARSPGVESRSSGSGQRQDAEGYEEAVRRGDLEAVRTFLAGGWPADAALITGDHPPLVYTLRSCDRGDNSEIALLLLQYGADPDDSTRPGLTPLMAAVEDCPVAVIEALLEAGADVDRRMGGSGTSGLEFARLYEREEIVELLLEHGAKER